MKRKDKETLVAIRLPKGAARQAGQMTLILIALAVFLGLFAALQYGVCQRDFPGRSARECFRGSRP